MRTFPLFSVFVSLAVSGCMTTPQRQIPNVNSESPYVSLCEIHSRESDFVGKIIRVRAIYATDTFTFADIRDDSCKEGPTGFVVINKNMYAANDETLRSMMAYQNSQCSGRVICNFKARLDADITLENDDGSGLLGVSIKHVYSITRTEPTIKGDGVRWPKLMGSGSFIDDP